MQDITKNEMRVLLMLFKDFNIDYNANNLSKKVGITPMGTLKILKKMEKQGIVKSKQAGNANFYKPDLDSNYAKATINFLLQKEAEDSLPRVKRWVRELRQLQNNAEIGILFGSLLNKEEFNDVDLLIVLKQKQNDKINEMLGNINKISLKRIHAVKQTKDDLASNLRKRDSTVLSMIKNGIILFGYDSFVEVIKNAAS